MKKIPMLEKFAAQSLIEHDGELIFSKEKFAELIVAECLAQVARVDDMLEDEPAQKAAVAWVASSIADHFGVESQAQFDQEAAEFIATEDKKVASRYGYFPKLHPSEWQD